MKDAMILLEAIGQLQDDYILDAHGGISQPASRRANSGGRFEKAAKHSSRKLFALVLAACLIMGLAITAYATGTLQSWLAKWAQSFAYETPTDELREARPGYAEWLDDQLETQAALEEMAENARQVNEEKSPEGLADASVALLESYYDGEKLTMACRFDPPQRPVTFDVDKNDPEFESLRELQDGYWCPAADWPGYVPQEADQQSIRRKLAEDGRVGFTTYAFILSDHVHVNGEDPGLSHTDINENDGVFYVDSFNTTPFGPGLPEVCRNQPELEITFIVRCCPTHYWLEGDTLRWANGACIDYPVSFTLENIHN